MMNISEFVGASEHDQAIGKILFPVAISFLLYCAAALIVWPYARPLVSSRALIASILFPPFFPFLLGFVLYTSCIQNENVVGKTEAVIRPVIDSAPHGRVRPAFRGRMGGNRV